MREVADCKHDKKFPMPDSIALVCENCGLVFINDKIWNYKSGHITDWVNDLGEKCPPLKN